MTFPTYSFILVITYNMSKFWTPKWRKPYIKNELIEPLKEQEIFFSYLQSQRPPYMYIRHQYYIELSSQLLDLKIAYMNRFHFLIIVLFLLSLIEIQIILL